MNLFTLTRETALGTITITASDSVILSVQKETNVSFPLQTSSPLLELAFSELFEYLDGNRQTFDLPLAPNGTPFQKKVWQALCTIPYGQTCSYQDIAAQIGNPNACRAVGMANHCNPIMIFIPCHRVIGKNGSLTGYAGGLDMKRQLLALERRFQSGAPKQSPL